MTRKLYLQDSYTTQFEAQVIKTIPLKKGVGVVLDQTYFYPEGGGQPSDRGTLNNLPLLGLSETKEGEILHIVALGSDISGSVVGEVDWGRRFDFMQQHTGQHILSQAAVRIANAPTVSWRLTSSSLSINVACSTLERDEIVAIEELANRIVYENRSVNLSYLSDPEILSTLPLRKQPLPQLFDRLRAPHLSEGVRIVEVDQFDYIPCGGTHCAKTGEVGSIRVSSWRKSKKNQWEIRFLCGKRALADYQHKRLTLQTLQQAFKVPEDKVKSKVLELMSQVDALRRSLDDAQQELLNHEAERIVNEAQLIGDSHLRLAVKIISDGDSRRLKALASKIKTEQDLIVVLAYQDTNSRLTIARSDHITHNANRIIKQLCQEFGGRGGGRAEIAHAGGFPPESVPALVERASEIIKAAT